MESFLFLMEKTPHALLKRHAEEQGVLGGIPVFSQMNTFLIFGSLVSWLKFVSGLSSAVAPQLIRTPEKIEKKSNLCRRCLYLLHLHRTTHLVHDTLLQMAVTSFQLTKVIEVAENLGVEMCKAADNL